MVSTDKLIKVGIKYTDKYFEDLKQLYIQAYGNSDSFEEFLNETSDYSISNPLEANEFKDKLTNIISSSINDIRFSRPAQKALMNKIIKQTTGELIVNVGEDIKQSVKNIVQQGYNTSTLSRQNVADEISSTLDGINRKRARVIARTEIKRAQTTSNYVVAKERGANAYKYKCGANPCTSICKVDCGEVFPIDDLEHLPPRHPNCRCGVTFFKDPNLPDATPTAGSEPTPEQLKANLTPSERVKYANFKRTIAQHEEWLRNNPNAPVEQIQNRQKRLAAARVKLDELVRKALGGETGGSPKPKATPKPKGKEKPKVKPKETPKPIVDNIPKLNPDIPNPTKKQLADNLTPIELKRYKRRIKEIRDISKWLKENPNDSYAPERRKILEGHIKDFENLKRKALGLKEVSDTKTPTPDNSKPKPSKTVDLEKPFDKSKMLTKEQLDKMSFKELAEHHGAEYQGVQVYNYDGRKYHVIKQTFKDGRELTFRIEEGAVKSYTKKGIATPNEIIHEVFKVPEALRIETREIWFKNTNQGIRVTGSKTGYDSLGSNVGGYNTYRSFGPKDGNNDYEHQIVINPKWFKGASGRTAYMWVKHPDNARAWKQTIHHEFTHSGDQTKDMWQGIGDGRAFSIREDYRKIEKEERGFTWYANTKISESFAEHGGYISYMESNPSEQNKWIEIQRFEEGKLVTKKINYEEYKQMYPKHYEYFMEKFKEGF